METNSEASERDTLVREMLQKMRSANPIQRRVFESNIDADSSLDVVRVYSNLLFDNSVRNPDAITHAISGFRMMGHKKVSHLITSEHANAYWEGMKLFTKERHEETYPDTMLTDVFRSMRLFSLAYMFSDEETREVSKTNHVRIARSLWESEITTLPETKNHLDRMKVMLDDSIPLPVTVGAL